MAARQVCRNNFYTIVDKLPPKDTIVFECLDVEIRAPRFILAGIEYFRALLDIGMKEAQEGRIKIEYPACVVGSILDYLYFDEHCWKDDLDIEHLFYLFDLSRMWRIDKISGEIGPEIEKGLTAANCVKVYEMAQNNRADEIIQSVECFMLGCIFQKVINHNFKHKPECKNKNMIFEISNKCLCEPSVISAPGDKYELKPDQVGELKKSIEALSPELWVNFMKLLLIGR